MDNYFASFWLLCTLVSMISEQQVLSTRKSSISAELSAIKRWKKTQGVKWINGNQPIELFVVLPSLGGTLTVLCTSLLINFHHNLPNQFVAGIRLIESTSKVLNHISLIVTIRVWVLLTEWIKRCQIRIWIKMKWWWAPFAQMLDYLSRMLGFFVKSTVRNKIQVIPCYLEEIL